MKIENLSAYRLIERHYSEDLKSEAWLLEHKKSGARISVLENDDENKVFYIAFRTPPKDSTGVAHILEHSVLCGSERFPLKDPFVELAKSSLNTFLNAMTYPDKTVYPIASCNDQDFKNLMHVYMDAVLHPNIYREEKIFRQEGWHYETDEDDNIIINGVVYNEMKGAFSSPDDVLSRETFSSLYPDTSYGVESGGDPEVIPDLSYQAFLDFHASYYHPVNSYIYLYGNADMEERLDWLDKEYLSRYDRITLSSHPGEQKPFGEMKYIRKEYPITEEEKEEKQTYLSYNATIGSVLDPELYIAFQMIDYALVGAEGTPLRKALLQAGIGTEIFSVYENGIYQPYYSIVAKNAEESDRDRFVEIVQETLRHVVKEGFDENALLASLNSLEFHFREADTGSYPKGLLYGLKALDSWLYDADKPFIHLEQLGSFARLRERIGSAYYTDLVQKYLIDNTHSSMLVLAPQKGLTAARDKALADKLAAYKAGLSETEFAKLKEDAAALKAYQDAEDEEAVKDMLPVLKLSDLCKEVTELVNEETELDGLPALFHEVDSNGILYLTLLFDMKDVPVRLLPYMGLLQRLLCSVDTQHYDYEQLGYEIDKRTGNISTSIISAVPDAKLEKYRRFFSMNLSVLSSQAKDGLELFKEIILNSRMDDVERLKEIIAETRSRLAAYMMSAGHSMASAHALSYLSEMAAQREMCVGLGFYRFVEDMEKHFDEKKEQLVEGLKEVLAFVFRSDNLLVDVSGSRQELELMKGELKDLVEKLPGCAPEDKKEKQSIRVEKANEGFTNSAQVQYVCSAGNFVDHGLPFTGSLAVLKTILSYDYLWNEVRVKGGAYGCMTRFNLTGEAYFVSYRDPNLERTLDSYRGVVEYLRNFNADEKTMTKYIIGTFGETDIPMTPRIKGARSLQAWLENDTKEKRQARRDQARNTTTEDIRALADYVEAVLSDDCICVVGNEEKIKAAKDCFAVVKPLFEN